MKPLPGWLVLWLFCGCVSRQTAVYRADRDIQELARALCAEVGALGTGEELSADVLRCDLSADVEISLRISGEVLRVEAASTWRHSDIALKLGVLAQQRGYRIELVELH